MKKLLEAINPKLSNTRVVVYLFVAISFLMACLIVFWAKSPYIEPLDTYHSKPPQAVKSYLYLSPNAGRYDIGDEFTVNVLINTAGSDVVATAAYLSFNKNAMQALSIDTSNSAFGLDAEKVINNEEGKIKITVGRPTPGVNSNTANVATIRFKALEQTRPILENISFDFTKGSSLYSTIIVDDKKGTNILSTTRGAQIIIN